MAIATLHELYGNHKVFTGVVKIRKGMAAKLILDTISLNALHKWFYIFASNILSRVSDKDPNADRTRAVCHRIITLTSDRAWTHIYGSYAVYINRMAPFALAVGSIALLRNVDFSTVSNPLVLFTSHTIRINTISIELVAACVCVVSILFMLSYSVVSTGKKGLNKGDKEY